MYGLPSISISRFSSLSSLVAISPSLESVEKGFYRTQANRRNETGMIRLEHGHGASIGRAAQDRVGGDQCFCCRKRFFQVGVRVGARDGGIHVQNGHGTARRVGGPVVLHQL